MQNFVLAHFVLTHFDPLSIKLFVKRPPNTFVKIHPNGAQSLAVGNVCAQVPGRLLLGHNEDPAPPVLWF